MKQGRTLTERNLPLDRRATRSRPQHEERERNGGGWSTLTTAVIFSHRDQLTNQVPPLKQRKRKNGNNPKRVKRIIQFGTTKQDKRTQKVNASTESSQRRRPRRRELGPSPRPRASRAQAFSLICRSKKVNEISGHNHRRRWKGQRWGRGRTVGGPGAGGGEVGGGHGDGD